MRRSIDRNGDGGAIRPSRGDRIALICGAGAILCHTGIKGRRQSQRPKPQRSQGRC